MTAEWVYRVIKDYNKRPTPRPDMSADQLARAQAEYIAERWASQGGAQNGSS